jgi:argininosuccinate lyase
MKGLPSGYNKDLQEDKEALFDTDVTLAGSLLAVTRTIETLRLVPARTATAASGLLLATDVAEYLVARGLPFRRAHEVVGSLVRQLLKDGRDFTSLSPAEWRAHSELFDASVADVVTPSASVRARRTPQSTGPEAVAGALRELNSWLGSL